MDEDNVFEGANHVLHGILTQIEFWNALTDHAAEKREMIPALTSAADSLRTALQRARGGTQL